MGTLLSVPVTDQHSGEVKGNNLSCGYTSMQGWRRTMEDSHIVQPEIIHNDKKFSFFGVFDGHGGDQVAAYCELAYIDTLMKTEAFKNSDYIKALIDTNIELDEQLKTVDVNSKLKTLGNGGSSMYDGVFGDFLADGIGCTSVVTLIIDNIIYCGNAGDSRCILYKGNEVIALSHDHKPTLQTEIDRIKKAGGTIDNGRVNGNLNLTRTIGDLTYKRQVELKPEEQIISCYPDVVKQQLDGTEKLLVLACDGIWDVLTNEELITKAEDYLKEGKSLQNTCECITNDCLSKQPYSTPGWDNMTLIIIKFDNYNPENSTPQEASTQPDIVVSSQQNQ